VTTSKRLRIVRIVLIVLVALTSVACAPQFLDRASSITSTRILAVQATPAEAKPGATVALAPFVVDANGIVEKAPLDFAFCTAPKPPTDNDSVAAACLDDDPASLANIASTSTSTSTSTSAAVNATLPGDGCARFGPENPSADVRPRDADATGGYFQPLRVADGDVVAFALVRLSCGVGGASIDVAHAYGAEYVPNTNPVAALHASARAHAGEAMPLEVTWPDATAEEFVVFDVARQALIKTREAITVSWFATAGALELDRTGRASDDHATSTTNTWTAPSSTGTAHLFAVVRDSRGGASFFSADVDVVANGG
jgi:hypothetical protein